jgi:hypothetical protein
MVKDTNRKFCISCGAELPHAARFCPQCGQSQSPDDRTDSVTTGSIHLKRGWAFKTGGVSWEVYMDDQFVGNVKNGSTFVFTASPGEHKVYVLCNERSNLLAFRIDAGQQIHMTCGLESVFSEAIFLRISS